jgi:hypothetical protein
MDRIRRLNAKSSAFVRVLTSFERFCWVYQIFQLK